MTPMWYKLVASADSLRIVRRILTSDARLGCDHDVQRFQKIFMLRKKAG